MNSIKVIGSVVMILALGIIIQGCGKRYVDLTGTWYGDPKELKPEIEDDIEILVAEPNKKFYRTKEKLDELISIRDAATFKNAQDNIVGMWNIPEVSGKDEIEFLEDGTYKTYTEGYVKYPLNEGTYSIDEPDEFSSGSCRIVINKNNGHKYSYKLSIEDNSLYIGDIINKTYTRKS